MIVKLVPGVLSNAPLDALELGYTNVSELNLEYYKEYHVIAIFMINDIVHLVLNNDKCFQTSIPASYFTIVDSTIDSGWNVIIGGVGNKIKLSICDNIFASNMDIFESLVEDT
jgi:hypothetical protein